MQGFKIILVFHFLYSVPVSCDLQNLYSYWEYPTYDNLASDSNSNVFPEDQGLDTITYNKNSAFEVDPESEELQVSGDYVNRYDANAGNAEDLESWIWSDLLGSDEAAPQSDLTNDAQRGDLSNPFPEEGKSDEYRRNWPTNEYETEENDLNLFALNDLASLELMMLENEVFGQSELQSDPFNPILEDVNDEAWPMGDYEAKEEILPYSDYEILQWLEASSEDQPQQEPDTANEVPWSDEMQQESGWVEPALDTYLYSLDQETQGEAQGEVLEDELLNSILDDVGEQDGNLIKGGYIDDLNEEDIQIPSVELSLETLEEILESPDQLDTKEEPANMNAVLMVQQYVIYPLPLEEESEEQGPPEPDTMRYEAEIQMYQTRRSSAFGLIGPLLIIGGILMIGLTIYMMLLVIKRASTKKLNVQYTPSPNYERLTNEEV